MSSSTRVGTAIAAGYFLGRFKKLRLALLVGSALANDNALEAIVERFGRPVLLVVGDTFEVPESDEWKSRLTQTQDAIDHAIVRVGRVEERARDAFLHQLGQRPGAGGRHPARGGGRQPGTRPGLAR